MRKLVARIIAAATLAAFAVPALPCEGVNKTTTASTASGKPADTKGKAVAKNQAKKTDSKPKPDAKSAANSL